MAETSDNRSLADVLGPFVDPNWGSSLIDRCKRAWRKPLRDLSREELATLLRQRIGVEHVLPIAQAKVNDRVDDNTEIYEGELQAAIDNASKSI